MNAATLRIMAILVTATALVISGMAGWYRGSSILDRMPLISIAIAISAGCHLIPSFAKSRRAWLLWVCCFIGALYSHLTFFSYTSMRAGDDRSKHSVQMSMVELQIKTEQEALALITARPLASIASELSITKNWRKRNALEMELSEAKRAVALRDEIVRLISVAKVTEETSATDPVTAGIARVTGITEQSIAFCSALGFSVLLELLGAFLWHESSLGRQEEPQMVSNSPTEAESLSRLKQKIAAGQVKPTVQAIRAFLRCSQTKAMEVRRKIATGGY